MAITRTATPTSFSTTEESTDWSFDHTVASGSTLLTLTVLCQADFAVSGTPAWNTTENFSLIRATTSSDSSFDARAYIYGLVNPTAGTHTISLTVTGTGTVDNGFACAVSYLGTVSSSVDDATNFLDEDINNDASTIVEMNVAAAGTAGATAFAIACFRGGDGDPAAETTSGGQFAEIFDGATGTSSVSDLSFWVGDAIDWTPAEVTVDWDGAISDECVGILIEILPALGDSVSLDPSTGAIAITGLAPAISIGSSLAPVHASLAIAGYAPSAAATVDVTPALAALRFLGIAPTVDTGAADLTEILTPNTILASSNLQDSDLTTPPELLTDLDDNPDGSPGPDELWWTAVDVDSVTDVRFGFPTSSGHLIGTQQIRVLVRGSSLPCRDVTVELWQAGSKLTSEVTESVTSIEGQIIVVSFEPEELSGSPETGADVEVRIFAAA